MQTLSRMIRSWSENQLQGKRHSVRLDSHRWRRSFLANRTLVALLMAGMMILQTGCSSQNSEAPTTDGTHPVKYANSVYSGSMEFHGTEVNLSGTDGCMSCHGRDLAGTDTVPGCTDCHFDALGSRVPPGSGWIHGLDQHRDYIDLEAVCKSCHDTNRQFGLPPDFCHDCHGQGINHILGRSWLDTNSPDFHGSADLTDCSSCHNLSTKCAECHFDGAGSKAPPASGWTHGNNPEHENYSVSQAVCNRCHDLSRSYGNGPAACHDCHGIVANHALGQPWLDPDSVTYHGSADLTDCSSCHDLSTKCAECHFDAAGSKAPPASGWSHGYNPTHENFSANQAVCNQCHALNRSYGNDPAACHDCHGIVANHALGQPWLDTKNAAYHGNVGLTDCSSCHYLDTTCFQCHFGPSGSKAPLGSGWNHGNNSGHRDFEAVTGICNQCHTVNRSYGNEPDSCHDCHGD